MRSVVMLLTALLSLAASLHPAWAQEPARIEVLADPAAEELVALKAKVPVLVARAGGGILAIVYATNESDATKMKERHLYKGEIEGCSAGDVTCCRAETKSYHLRTVEGWLDIGDRCDPVAWKKVDESLPEEEAAKDNPKEAGAEFVKLTGKLSRLLTDRGVDYRFAQLASGRGGPRALVIDLGKGAALSVDRPKLAGLRDLGAAVPPVLQASHKGSTPSGGCVGTISACKTNSAGDRCRKTLLHWYYKDAIDNVWCEMPTTCTC